MNLRVVSELTDESAKEFGLLLRYRGLLRVTQSVLRTYKPLSITIVLIGDTKMRALNASYRGLNRTTDVLSFFFAKDFGERDASGEIYISIPQAKRQARSHRTSLKKELKRLVVHGLLHVQGFDHVKPDERAVMRSFEKKISNAATREKIW